MTDKQDPPSALTILSETFNDLDKLDEPEGFNLTKSFRSIVRNLNHRRNRTKLNEYAENSSWLSNTPFFQVKKTAFLLSWADDDKLASTLNEWLFEKLDDNNELQKTLKRTLADTQVTKDEFAKIISEYALDKFNTPENQNNVAKNIETARIFAKAMGIEEPSERLLEGLALFEAEGQNTKGKNIGDVLTLQLGSKP